MTSTMNDISKLSASHLTTSNRNHSFTSMSSDARSFHTAVSPVDMEEERNMRAPSPLLRSTSPIIPRRTSSQFSKSNTTIIHTRTNSPIPRTISPIPNYLRSPTPTNLGIVTRSPSYKSHTPFPYTVSQKMERSDSGYDDGREGKTSPLSATEQKEKTKEIVKTKRKKSGSESTSRASSRPTSSYRSSPQSTPNTSISNTTRSSSTSTATRHSSSSKRPKQSSSTQITRSQSYQAPQKPRLSTRNGSYPTNEISIQECRLSNMRQRHCFYQFPPLPSSPPSTGMSRKGSGAGLSLNEYAIPPPNHPYHQTNYSTTNQPASLSSPLNTSQSTFHRTISSDHIDPKDDTTPAVPLPPPTTLYFLSPETRRLEYAAIDAASQGIRGFVSKLVPDCMLPKPERCGFHDDGKVDDDAGSVRRYRLVDVGVTGEVRRSEDSGVWDQKKGSGKKASWSGWKKWVSGLKGGSRVR